MNIQVTNTGFCGANVCKLIPHNNRETKYMQEACNKLSVILREPTCTIVELTKNSDMKRFSFLQKMVNKYNFQNKDNIARNPESVLNIYSMVEKPTPMHFSIVSKTKDSFESIEKIFSLANDEKTLEFVQDVQYGVLKDSDYTSKIIIDMLSSKNRNKYINNAKDYASYLKLHADNKEAIANLDKLINSGKFSKLRSDAQLAVKNLMKKQNMKVAMAGKTRNLEAAYTSERESFLKKIVNNFIPRKNEPTDATKNTVVDMYETLNAENTKLRYEIMDRFKYNRNDKTAEIVEMKVLFDRIDKDKEAKKFVQKAIIKDLKIPSIAELNEVLDTVPLRKANVFFNNAKRIIEQASGEERKTALVKELENPFFKAKEPQKKAKIIRMYSPYERQEGFLSKTARFIENKINQFIYNHMAV